MLNDDFSVILLKNSVFGTVVEHSENLTFTIALY